MPILKIDFTCSSMILKVLLVITSTPIKQIKMSDFLTLLTHVPQATLYDTDYEEPPTVLGDYEKGSLTSIGDKYARTHVPQATLYNSDYEEPLTELGDYDFEKGSLTSIGDKNALSAHSFYDFYKTVFEEDIWEYQCSDDIRVGLIEPVPDDDIARPTPVCKMYHLPIGKIFNTYSYLEIPHESIDATVICLLTFPDTDGVNTADFGNDKIRIEANNTNASIEFDGHKITIPSNCQWKLNDFKRLFFTIESNEPNEQKPLSVAEPNYLGRSINYELKSITFKFYEAGTSVIGLTVTTSVCFEEYTQLIKHTEYASQSLYISASAKDFLLVNSHTIKKI